MSASEKPLGTTKKPFITIHKSTPSVVEEPALEINSQELQRPHPLLRKKSGELIKSSLKLPSLSRSMSTPQLKSVRFAARIANIKMFDGTESPSAVLTCENSPVHSPPRLRGHDYFQMHEEDSDTSDDEVQLKPKEANYGIVYSDVPQYEPHVGPTATLKLHSLRLEKNADGRTVISGLINCANLAYEKNLMVKLTWDNWKSNMSFSNAPTIRYHKLFPRANVDQFMFRIPLHDLHHHTKYNAEVNLQLCIEYRTANQVFWDNNGGRNYNFRLKPKNTISTYTYKKPEGHDELVSKLMNIQQDSPSTRKTIHSRYNFGNEDKNTESRPTFVRPQLKMSLLVNDVTRKYSQSYKKKGEKKAQVDTQRNDENVEKKDKADTSPIASFASLSYTDLLANYCFLGGSKKVTEASVPRLASTSTLNGVLFNDFGSASKFGLLCLPASTFHAFSDSIHI